MTITENGSTGLLEASADAVASDDPGGWVCQGCGFRGFWSGGPHCLGSPRARATRMYPTAWGLELVRNEAGRAFWFVSRFVAPGRLEYVTDASGAPECFRLVTDAKRALQRVYSPPL